MPASFSVFFILGMDVKCIQEIQRALPELDYETLVVVVVEHLASVVGVTKKEDLAYVEKDDLQHLLTPIQCRKVIQTFKQRGEKLSWVSCRNTVQIPTGLPVKT